MLHNFPKWKFVCWSELSAQPQERKGGQGTAANHCLAAVPCPPLGSCGWAKSSLTQYSTMEIPNKTFILDYHRPFICSVELKVRALAILTSRCLSQASSKRQQKKVLSYSYSPNNKAVAGDCRPNGFYNDVAVFTLKKSVQFSEWVFNESIIKY